MNERIKELALQAGFGEQWFEQHPTGCALPKPLMLKEYTELIVRECARIADRKYLYSKEPNRWDSGFNISCEILEQFGILKDE
jgi:hypothetical protein